ncbi:hypothetical protein FOWG_18281 [Fusarium oxysporum f. sp. lycopersici MN25]|nr:hypothetical protein FOWG_18281 [Fusarium oxysporum f. sp. lycopersici MN25]
MPSSRGRWRLSRRLSNVTFTNWVSQDFPSIRSRRPTLTHWLRYDIPVSSGLTISTTRILQRSTVSYGITAMSMDSSEKSTFIG